ncbi:MAG: lysozyme [Flammeovirgaceae bacterium]|jgi:lysozyme
MRRTLFFLLASLLFCISSCNNEKQQSAGEVTKEDSTKKISNVEIKEHATKDTSPVIGIDVSHFQGNIDWIKIKQSGVQFCYAKASQGNYFKDLKFQENKHNTEKADLVHGAYHFYMTNEDPKKQAMLFLSCLDKEITNQMLPMLDLEGGSIKGEIDIEAIQKNVMIWLTTVEEALGVKPIIYTNNPFANTYLKNPEFANYKLWLAEYGVEKPRTPHTWRNQGWVIWQRSPNGFVDGSKGDIDHDILAESQSLEELIFSKK